MTTIQILFTLFFLALGHLVRDGWPPTGSTQGARAIGGVLAMLGAYFVKFDPIMITLGAAVWVGFYADQKHGEGQGGRTLKDAMYLSISGITSLIPFACVMGYLYGWLYAIVGLAGFAKVPIWLGWWRTPIQSVGSWFQPTRMAAITFGLVVGGLMLLAK